MKTISVKVTDNNCASFPIRTDWRIGSVNYSNVFETEEQMKIYFNRYWSVRFIYK